MAERIHGLDGLRAAFAEIGRDLREKTARRITAAGAAVLRKEAKDIVTKKGLISSRALINNIAIKREPRTPPGIVQYNLGVRHGRALGRKAEKYLALGRGGRVVTKRKNDPFYWRFLEFGHKLVPRAKAGGPGIAERRRRAIGSVEATPFIRPALENKKLEALAAMERQAERIAEKAGK